MSALNDLLTQINEAIAPDEVALYMRSCPLIRACVHDPYDVYPVRGDSRSRVWVMDHPFAEESKLITVQGGNPNTPFEVLASELLRVLNTPRVAH